MLTGISQETHFSPPSSICYLVFNDGDLKVPVTEEQAQLVLEQLEPMLLAEEKVDIEVPNPTRPPNHDVIESDEEEDGIGQA
jgi:hypothetical protein